MRLQVPAYFLIAIAFATSSAVAQSRIEGAWEGSIEIPGTPLKIELDFALEHDSLTGQYSIPLQGIDGYPLERIAVQNERLSFVLGGGIPGDPMFDLEFSDDDTRLSGTFSQGGRTFDVAFSRQEESAAENLPGTVSEKTEAIRAIAADARTRFNVPGIAIGVVDRKGVLLEEGFGLRNIEEDLPVTSSTLFAIGSTTKAFTATLIGMLVDQGLVEWSEPVRSYIPDFKLQDEYATNHMTVRDLLTHVSGLPRHDALWYASSRTREDLLNALAHLEPTHELRQTWQYQNLMFMVGGILCERIAGGSWESLVRDRMFGPLGMNRSNFDVDELATLDDVAVPYAQEEDSLKRIDYRNIDAVGPAGSINSSVEEMGNWLRFNLNKGMWNDEELISSQTLTNIQSPHAVMTSAYDPTDPMSFQLYGMGWMVSTYRDHRIVHHGGGIDGFVSHVALFPDDGYGIVVLTNTGSAVPQALTLDIADILLEETPIDNLARAEFRTGQLRTMMKNQVRLRDVDRIPDTDPRWPLSSYAGTYSHPAYGVVTIELREERLFARYGTEEYPLRHYHYDVFRTDSGTGFTGEMLLTFTTGPSGRLTGVDIPLETSVSPIHFKRRPDSILRQPDFLQQMAGEYESTGQTATVSLQDSTLILQLPHQPTYTLEGLALEKGSYVEFAIESLSGFRVRFIQEEGVFNRILFIQPNGTFEATRE